MDQKQLNQRMARMRGGLAEAYSDEMVLTVKCNRTAAEALEPLLNHIRKTGGVGHTFSIVVDPDSSDYRKTFGFDGDGPDRIGSVEIADA
jgi:hypothetical protein